MTRDYRDYLEDILSSIDETAAFTADLSFEAFVQDRKTVNAVVRSLEVLGEAAKCIPLDLRAGRILTQHCCRQISALCHAFDVS
ncbi:DUF86 domain-containing protein [Candidatus Sumerlaeota bacterium]|nr:DUF86 domain-containing protein [Candidatus Sumerlaeota bacterium]